MSFIENNPLFQQWGGDPRVDPDSGTRAYGSAFGPEVLLREGDNYLHLNVFVDGSDGVTASEWFAQFFPVTDDAQSSLCDEEVEF